MISCLIPVCPVDISRKSAGRGSTYYTAFIGMVYEVVINYVLYFELILQHPCWKI